MESRGTSEGRSFRVRLSHSSVNTTGKTQTSSSTSTSSSLLNKPVNILTNVGEIQNKDEHEIAERNNLYNFSKDQQELQPIESSKTPYFYYNNNSEKNQQDNYYKVNKDEERENNLVEQERENIEAELRRNLEEEVMRRVRERSAASERESQLKKNYMAKITELEDKICIIQHARELAESTLTQKETEWANMKHVLTQKLNEEALVYARRTVESTLRAREKDITDTQEILQAERVLLAESQQREEVLRERLIVAEESSVLHQLYLHRLLELLRGQTIDEINLQIQKKKKLVTNEDVISTLINALRSTNSATDGNNIRGSDILQEFTPEGKRSEGNFSPMYQENKYQRNKLQLTNATLLMSSMLESKVIDCLTYCNREEKRKYDNLIHTFKSTINSYTEEVEAKLSLIISSLRKMDQRLSEYSKIISTTLDKYVKISKESGNRMEQTQQEFKRINQEYIQSQRQLNRAQAEITNLKDEISRLDTDREAALLIHRAAECLEDVRQSVRNSVRSAAHHIEQSALESNTLKEPFIQSIRVIATKVESHVEMTRNTLRREQNERVNNNNNFKRNFQLNNDIPDRDEIYRRILSPPQRNSTNYEQRGLSSCRENSIDASNNLMMLEELTRVMKNLCTLLENNAQQMSNNTTKVTHSISNWENAIIKKMTEIWECMRGALIHNNNNINNLPAQIINNTTRRGWNTNNSNSGVGGNEPILSLRDNYTSHTAIPTENPSHIILTSAGNVLKTSQNGNLSVSGSCLPSVSGGPSCISSAEVSRTASSAPATSLWRNSIPVPLQEREKTPERYKSCGESDVLSPPSIAVSHAATPAPSMKSTDLFYSNKQQQQQINYTESSYSTLSPVNGPSTVPRLHYTSGNMNNLEKGGEGVRMVSVSGAIFARRTVS